MKQLKIVIIRFIFFFYLTSSYLSATHIHTDALASHADCKVCIVVKNLHSGDAPIIFANDLHCNGCYEPIAFELRSVQQIILKGFNANAPPQFS